LALSDLDSGGRSTAAESDALALAPLDKEIGGSEFSKLKFWSPAVADKINPKINTAGDTMETTRFIPAERLQAPELEWLWVLIFIASASPVFNLPPDQSTCEAGQLARQ
jgi:hypothetical protein